MWISNGGGTNQPMTKLLELLWAAKNLVNLSA